MSATAEVLVVESVSHLDPSRDYGVIICGSHGGVAAAIMLSRSARSVRAVIFNDAGLGLDTAGISGLAWLEAQGIAAAAVAHSSARIGDGDDMASRGLISAVNMHAAEVGVTAGMSCQEGSQLLKAALLKTLTPAPPSDSAGRFLIGRQPLAVWCLDSASLVRSSDAGAIVLTGSHGGLLGGRSASAVKSAVFAAFYNDAAGGIDDAGFARLPALDAMNVIGATVSAASARIGDGRSTYEDGVLSAVNKTASVHGGRVGEPARAFVEHILNQYRKAV